VTFRDLVRRYAWPFRKDIGLILLLALVANALVLANPVIIATALATLDLTEDAAPPPGGRLDLDNLGDRVLARLPVAVTEDRSLVITLLAVAFVVQAFGVAGLNYVVALRTLRVPSDVARRVRTDLVRHLFSLPLSFFHHEKSGELMARVTQDAANIGHSVGPLVRNLIYHNVQLIGYGAYLLWTDAALTVVVVAIIGSHFALSQMLRPRMRAASKVMVDRSAYLTADLQESLTSIRVAKSFGSEGYEVARLERSIADVADATMAEGRVHRLEEPTRSMLDSLAIFAIFVFAAVQVRAGRLTIEGLVLYLYVGRQLMMPANLAATNYLGIQSLAASFDRIGELLSMRSPLLDGPETRATLERGIQLRSVTFSYGRHRALDDVSLEIRKGEVVALVGPSGAGKSTLTDLILRLYDPDAGDVLIDGVNVRRLAQAPYRRWFGVVSQESLLFHDTIANNIRYGRDGITDEAIVRAARIANAHDFVSRLPDGYDTVVGDRGVRLSGGERQRVAIARAVVHQPQILILDEATSALDSESEREVQAAIERVTQGVTSIIVAHRLSTVLHADKIVVLERGRIIDQGRHDELMERCGLYAQLCRLQFGVLQPELLG
jgi:subfamily B ATP-binding cassette protein MsbA